MYSTAVPTLVVSARLRALVAAIRYGSYMTDRCISPALDHLPGRDAYTCKSIDGGSLRSYTVCDAPGLPRLIGPEPLGEGALGPDHIDTRIILEPDVGRVYISRPGGVGHVHEEVRLWRPRKYGAVHPQAYAAAVCHLIQNALDEPTNHLEQELHPDASDDKPQQTGIRTCTEHLLHLRAAKRTVWCKSSCTPVMGVSLWGTSPLWEDRNCKPLAK